MAKQKAPRIGLQWQEEFSNYSYFCIQILFGVLSKFLQSLLRRRWFLDLANLIYAAASPENAHLSGAL